MPFIRPKLLVIAESDSEEVAGDQLSDFERANPDFLNELVVV